MTKQPDLSLTKSKMQLKKVRSRNLKSALRKKLIEFFPASILVGPEQQRPLLLLKDELEKITVPVWLNYYEAGASFSQNSIHSPAFVAHHFTIKLLKSLDLQIERCILTKVQGHYQYADLEISNHPQLKKLTIRADEVMSLCIYLKVPIFCNRQFIVESKELEIEMGDVRSEVKLYPQLLSNDGPSYLM